MMTAVGSHSRVEVIVALVVMVESMVKVIMISDDLGVWGVLVVVMLVLVAVVAFILLLVILVSPPDDEQSDVDGSCGEFWGNRFFSGSGESHRVVQQSNRIESNLS